MKQFFFILVIFVGVSCQKNSENTKELAKQEILVEIAKAKANQRQMQEEYEKFPKKYANAESELSQDEVRQMIAVQEQYADVLQKQKGMRLTENDKKSIDEEITNAQAIIQRLKKQLK